MRNALLVLALLSISCYVSAQQITPVRPAKSDMCPIGFGVQIDGRAVARTVEDEKKNGDGPLLELTFKRRDAQKDSQRQRHRPWVVLFEPLPAN